MAIRPQLEAVGITVEPGGRPVEPELPRQDPGHARPRHPPARLDRRLQRHRQLRRRLLRQASQPSGASTTRSCSRRSTEARGIPTREEQAPAYEDINQQVMEFLPGVPLAHPVPSLAFAPEVEGYQTSPGAGRGLERGHRRASDLTADPGTSPTSRGPGSPTRPDRAALEEEPGVLRFVLRRLALLVPVLLGLSVLLFLWVRALPGRPGPRLLGERATPDSDRHGQPALRLRPAAPRAVLHVHRRRCCRATSALDADRRAGHRRCSGRASRRPSSWPSARWPFAVVLGIPLGYFAARRHGTALDSLTVGGSLLGVVIPVFFLAYLLKLRLRHRHRAVRGARRLPDRRAAEPAHRRDAPHRLLRPRRPAHPRVGRRLGRARAPGPARRRARHDPARDHRPHHPRRPCST